MNFAEILKKTRYDSGETQKNLSEKIGYSQSVISEWEKGTIDPTSQALIALAKHYHLTVDYLLGIEKNQTNTNDTDEQLLLEAYRAMSPGKRQALLSMLDIEQTQENKKQG